MERFTIGRCRSGKILTSHPDLDGFSSVEEIFDAYAALSVVALRERRRDKTSEWALHLSDEVSKLEVKLDSSGDFQKLRDAIGVATSIDIMRHGSRLLNPEFREYRE